MKRLLPLALAALFVGFPAFAEDDDYTGYGYSYSYKPSSGYTYDWKNSNSYRWNRDTGGTTTLNGFNWNSGATWRTRIQPNGDMSGTDSNMNYWRYNSETGYYWNSNGKTCFGKGRLRTCY